LEEQKRVFLGGLPVKKRHNQLHMITSECVHATIPVYGKNHQDLHDHSLFHKNSELAASSSIMLARLPLPTIAKLYLRSNPAPMLSDAINQSHRPPIISATIYGSTCVLLRKIMQWIGKLRRTTEAGSGDRRKLDRIGSEWQGRSEPGPPSVSLAVSLVIHAPP
jgi:hypothetical protein